MRRRAHAPSHSAVPLPRGRLFFERFDRYPFCIEKNVGHELQRPGVDLGLRRARSVRQNRDKWTDTRSRARRGSRGTSSFPIVRMPPPADSLIGPSSVSMSMSQVCVAGLAKIERRRNLHAAYR